VTGEGVAAIITATFAGILGVLSFWRGYQKDKRLRAAPTPTTAPSSTEIEAGVRAVEAYKALMGDLEEDRARMRVERDTERELRVQGESVIADLRRRLAVYELPASSDREGVADG
jgi:hypothetical protein